METKSENPANYLKDQDINPIIRAYYEFNQLKVLYRQGWLKRGIPRERCESVAEHSLGVAVLVCWLAETYDPDLDLCRALRMALVHDFGEVYAGDITPEEGIPRREKYLLERQSVGRVFSDLPGGDRYIELWEEYEDGTSAEARFVRQVDRLEMAMQASVYGQQGSYDLSEFCRTALDSVSDPQIQNLLRELADCGVE
jgi:putative hydrolase of HD superfamily